jgi:hypothetical protein
MRSSTRSTVLLLQLVLLVDIASAVVSSYAYSGYQNYVPGTLLMPILSALHIILQYFLSAVETTGTSSTNSTSSLFYRKCVSATVVVVPSTSTSSSRVIGHTTQTRSEATYYVVIVKWKTTSDVNFLPKNLSYERK